MAKCYGFRNIQNIVQKIKRQKCPFDYIEIMACPSGCANGGGQIRAETTEERENILTRVEEKYRQLIPSAEMECEIERVKNEWASFNDSFEKLFYSSYQVVDKSIMESFNLRW